MVKISVNGFVLGDLGFDDLVDIVKMSVEIEQSIAKFRIKEDLGLLN